MKRHVFQFSAPNYFLTLTSWVLIHRWLACERWNTSKKYNLYLSANFRVLKHFRPGIYKSLTVIYFNFFICSRIKESYEVRLHLAWCWDRKRCNQTYDFVDRSSDGFENIMCFLVVLTEFVSHTKKGFLETELLYWYNLS